MQFKDSLGLSSLNWKLFFQFLALFGFLGLAYLPSVDLLVDRWIQWDEEMSHAIPTLAIFFLLILRSYPSSELSDSKLTRALLITLLGALSCLWFIFIKTNIGTLANLVVFCMVPVVIAASYSFSTAWSLIPAITILVFTLPIFSQINNLLVELSAQVVGYLVQIFGITALIDGQNIYLPSGHIYIAGGCSGLRYLTIAMLMGYLVSAFNHYSILRGLFTISLGAILGLLTNWIRIFALVMIGQATGMKSSLMHNHELFGWILFAGIMLPAIYFAPLYHQPAQNTDNKLNFKPYLPLAVLCLGPILLLLSDSTPKESVRLNLAMIDGFSIQPKQSSKLMLVFPEQKSIEKIKDSTDDEDFINSENFLVDSINVRATLARYHQESVKNKLVPYFETLFNPLEWREFSSLENAWLYGYRMHAEVLKRINDQQFHLMVYRYEIGKYNTANYEVAKILQMPASFLGYRYFNIIVFDTPCSDQYCQKELASTEKIADTWARNTKNFR